LKTTPPTEGGTDIRGMRTLVDCCIARILGTAVGGGVRVGDLVGWEEEREDDEEEEEEDLDLVLVLGDHLKEKFWKI